MLVDELTSESQNLCFLWHVMFSPLHVLEVLLHLLLDNDHVQSGRTTTISF